MKKEDKNAQAMPLHCESLPQGAHTAQGAQRREIRWVVDDATASAQPRGEIITSHHFIELCSHMLSRYIGSAARAKSARDFFSSTLNI